jgi:hypothetical protein
MPKYAFSLPKAGAWAKPGQGQAVSGGFGPAQVSRKPKPPRAKPKPGLLGQAGPEHHYVTPFYNLENNLAF